MAMFHRFDLSSSFTLFFLFLMVFFTIVAMLLARAAPKKRKSGRVKHDDMVIDRNRELID